MLAKEIMTKDVITVLQEASIKEVLTILTKEKISGVVVVDDHGKMCGIVSEKDLIVSYDFLKEAGASIKEFVTRDIVSVKADDSLDDILKMLVHKNIKRIPVVEGDKLLGIISRGDIMKAMLDQMNSK